MAHNETIVTPARFATGMTCEEYVAYAGTPENRFMRNWGALLQSPFVRLWASAAVDEILSALHERVVIGAQPSDSTRIGGSS